MADSLDISEMRLTLTRVTLYKQVCEQVRAGAGGTLFNGLLFLGIAYFSYNMMGKLDPATISLGIIGIAELLVGLWKKAKPSPECVLLDGLLHVAFVLSIAYRQFLHVQAGGQPNTISILIALWVGYDAIQTFAYYATLRRLLVERPTAEHLAYVDNLRQEIAQSEPTTDATILDLPTTPEFKARLLGEIAFLVDMRNGAMLIVDRVQFRLQRKEASAGQPARGYLTLDGESFPPFPLDMVSWNNYRNWKAQGGEEIPA